MKKLITLVTILVLTTLTVTAGYEFEDIGYNTNTPSVLDALSTSNTNRFYVGGAYTYVDASIDRIFGKDLTVSNDGLTILAGFNFNKFLAIEGRYSWLTESDFGGYDRNVDGDTYGVYVKPQYPVTNDVGIYALVGYGEINRNGGFDVTNYSIDNVQYGLGGTYKFSKNIKLFADWLRAANDSIDNIKSPYNVNDTTDLFTFGATYNFKLY